MINLVLFSSTSVPHSHICLQIVYLIWLFNLNIWFTHLDFIFCKKKISKHFPHLGPLQNLHFHALCNQITTSFCKISKFSHLSLSGNFHLLIGAVTLSNRLICVNYRANGQIESHLRLFQYLFKAFLYLIVTSLHLHDFLICVIFSSNQMKSILKTSFSHLGFLQIFESFDLWGNFHFFGWFICITVWWICGVFGSNWKQLIMSYYTPSCCSSPPKSSSVSAELKVYQAFIFSVPIFFTFILLLLFYLFYLRRRRVDWSSLRMRTSLHTNNVDEISRVRSFFGFHWFIYLILLLCAYAYACCCLFKAELGLKKELREMLPIVIYKESFSIRDTQWVSFLWICLNSNFVSFNFGLDLFSL